MPASAGMTISSMLSFPPDPAPVEAEIFEFFAGRNFERSRRFGTGAYNPEHLRKFLAALGNPQFSYKTISPVPSARAALRPTSLARWPQWDFAWAPISHRIL
jgi:hypothetical protein